MRKRRRIYTIMMAALMLAMLLAACQQHHLGESLSNALDDKNGSIRKGALFCCKEACRMIVRGCIH